MKWLEQLLSNNTPSDWLAALLAAVGVVFFLMIFKRVIVRYIRVYARKTDIKLDDLLASTLLSTRPLLLLPLALYAGALWLTLPPRLDRLIEHSVIIVLLSSATSSSSANRWGPSNTSVSRPRAYAVSAANRSSSPIMTYWAAASKITNACSDLIRFTRSENSYR